MSELLAVASGGVMCTTIQKFLPEKGAQMPALSEQRNIIVIADEAHRSQYVLIAGLARRMNDALPRKCSMSAQSKAVQTVLRQAELRWAEWV